MINVTYDNVLPGFLLLFLAMITHLLAPTSFSCELRTTIENNIVYKNILLFLLMYFMIYFTYELPEPPSISLVKTIVLYIFYLFFAKQKPNSLILGLFLLVAAFICEQSKAYLLIDRDGDTRKQTHAETEKKKSLELAQIILGGSCVGVVLIGFMIAYRELKAKHSNLTFINYLFSNFNCSNLSI